MQGTRARVLIAADSLRIDRWVGDSWGSVHRWPGPDRHGVTLAVSNPVVVFDAIGIGWGASNTTVVLRRGPWVEKITLSRIGGSSGGSGACNPFPGMGIKRGGAATGLGRGVKHPADPAVSGEASRKGRGRSVTATSPDRQPGSLQPRVWFF